MRFRDCHYVIFDLDGTLTDPKEGITGSAVYALRKLGYPHAGALGNRMVYRPPAPLVLPGAYGLHGGGGQTACRKIPGTVRGFRRP